jgi:hypothetical protein
VFGSGTKQNVNNFKVGFARPASVVKGGAFQVIDKVYACLDFFNQKLDHFCVTSSAGNVYQTISEAIAAIQLGSRFVELSQLVEVIETDSSGYLKSVCLHLLWCWLEPLGKSSRSNGFGGEAVSSKDGTEKLSTLCVFGVGVNL